MSSRYERGKVASPSARQPASPAPTARAGLSGSQDPEPATAAADNRAAWDALDRGDDPTVR